MNSEEHIMFEIEMNITVIGKDNVCAAVIREFNIGGNDLENDPPEYPYVLSDYIHCNDTEIGWFTSPDIVPPGACVIQKQDFRNAYTFCLVGGGSTYRISAHGMCDNSRGVFIDIMETNKVLKTQASQIKELEAELELCKSTREFIDECERLAGKG